MPTLYLPPQRALYIYTHIHKHSNACTFIHIYIYVYIYIYVLYYILLYSIIFYSIILLYTRTYVYERYIRSSVGPRPQTLQSFVLQSRSPELPPPTMASKHELLNSTWRFMGSYSIRVPLRAPLKGSHRDSIRV